MCANHPPKNYLSSLFFLSALSLGFLAGYFEIQTLLAIAQNIQTIFQKLMKLISVPIIFLSIFSIILKMHGKMDLKKIFKSSLFYTLLTTTLSACVALLLIFVFKNFFSNPASIASSFSPFSSSWNWIDEIIPEHAFQPFMTGNVMSSLILAIFMGIAFTKVSDKQKIEAFSDSILEGLMKMATILLKGMPLIVFSSLALTMKIGDSFKDFKSLSLFLSVVVLANLIQGTIILPLILKFHGIKVWKTFQGFKEALIYAFFSKSSIATLPIAKKCAEENLKISPAISQFTFPIFTTINMNGCAAFILTSLTLGFLQQFPSLDVFQVLTVLFLSVIAAVGNAGVPMGCYFLSTALLSAFGLDLKLIGLVLPIYGMIDMLETSLNVWSDSVITTIIDHSYKTHPKVEPIR